LDEESADRAKDVTDVTLLSHLESGDRETSLPPHDAATADREIRHMTDGGDHETENPEG